MRLCSNCKIEYPLTVVSPKCPKCRHEFDEQVCNTCLKLLPNSQYYRSKGYITRECKVCWAIRRKRYAKERPEVERARQARFKDRRRAKAQELFDKWLKLKELPFKPMTEEQWLLVCKYFDGCAICGNEHIEAREFFLNFKDGGRYAAWNMFPTCGSCAVHTKKIENPFIWLDEQVGGARFIGMSKEKAERLKQYFIAQVEAMDVE